MNSEIDRLGIIIKSAREDMHLTQKQLAERLSISTRYLISIEHSRKKPSYELLFKIIRELEISANIIFYPEHGTNPSVIEKLNFFLCRCDEHDLNVIMTILQSLFSSKNT